MCDARREREYIELIVDNGATEIVISEDMVTSVDIKEGLARKMLECTKQPMGRGARI